MTELLQDCFAEELVKRDKQITSLQARNAKLLSALMSYNEYFQAISDGHYNDNRRPRPLRALELMLLDRGREAIKEAEEK